jgi:predicted lipoprotein with Yx(FWY)xxD motif
LGGVTLVAACSSQSGGGPTAAPPTQAATAGSGLTLEVANDPELGDFVAGADGMTLYVFLPDEGDTSACNGECAVNWPPLTGEVAAGAGVTGALGTITREDGSAQVTLGGAPLYYFIGDEAAGDVNGQGLQDVWYLASPAGTPVGASDGPAPAPEETPCTGRYCY